MKHLIVKLIFLTFISNLLFSCNKEKSIDASAGGSGGSGTNSLIGNWKLLYITSEGNEEGTYTDAGINRKDIYIYKDSTINNNGLFSFSKDSLAYGISYIQTGNEWYYSYRDGTLFYADSSDYNTPESDAGVLPYKIKGDSVTLIDNSGAGMFDQGIPATYKYAVNGDKLTLTGKFDFVTKDTLLNYIETYNVSISSKIYLQKQ